MLRASTLLRENLLLDACPLDFFRLTRAWIASSFGLWICKIAGILPYLEIRLLVKIPGTVRFDMVAKDPESK